MQQHLHARTLFEGGERWCISPPWETRVARCVLAIFAGASARTFSRIHRAASATRGHFFQKKVFPSAVSVYAARPAAQQIHADLILQVLICRQPGGATRSCAAALVKFKASPRPEFIRRCRVPVLSGHYALKSMAAQPTWYWAHWRKRR